MKYSHGDFPKYIRILDIYPVGALWKIELLAMSKSERLI